MISFSCFLTRRRIGALLDQALTEGRSRSVVSHLSVCTGCREEAARLERLRSLLRGALDPGPEPEWVSFWPSVRERISAESGSAKARPRLTRSQVWSYPRLALSGALAGFLLLAVALWQGGPWRSGADAPPWMAVPSVETVQPNSSVMVFSTPDSDMTMIWVFGLERGDDQSLRIQDPPAQWRV